jgi:excisionase family DNA binding protein
METSHLTNGSPTFLLPSTDEAPEYRESSRKLREIGNPANADVHVRVRSEESSEQTIPIPVSALQLLSHIFSQLAQGNGVTLIPMQAEITTTEAARILKVSRPFLIMLLEKGEIPFRMTGTHRRILVEDLMAFKRKNENERLKALEELSALDQEYGLR